VHHVDCRPVEWHATTDEDVQHNAKSPHIDGRARVVQIRDRNLSPCSWLDSVQVSQQLRGRMVLLTAACHERCCRESHRVSGGNSDRCECKIRDDGTASCFAGCCSAIDTDEDVFEFKICGGRVLYGLCACHEGEEIILYYGAPPHARG
jgi:hypothetical protein